MSIAYRTALGTCFSGTAEAILQSPLADAYHHKVDLIFTSPPFPLNTKKKYGNLQGQAYVEWLAGFAPLFADFLAPTGSIVMEMGNAWEPSRPIMSVLALRALIAFIDRGHFVLCQQFIYHNPAKLPTPAQWVNIERIRVKDSYTHLWWMASNDRPKADNRRVLKEYSKAMKRLLETRKYNAGERPSHHKFNDKSFLHDNKGAIPSNVITISNTQATSDYLTFCRTNGLSPHPARMPIGLPEFFINFLTEPGDLVLDPFGGSNTTGAAAQKLDRKWISIEPSMEYIHGSLGRFSPLPMLNEDCAGSSH